MLEDMTERVALLENKLANTEAKLASTQKSLKKSNAAVMELFEK